MSSPGSASVPSGHLPDIASALRWRAWGEGSEEARRRGVPMLVLAEPAWANSAQRLALRFQQDEMLRELVTSRVVPVLVDPDARPDLVAAWRWAAVALTGTAGPPLLLLLTHEGLPFLAYCTMAIEGDDTYPSLTSLLESLTESYAINAAGIGAEARALAVRGISPAGDTRAAMDWDALRQRLDLRRGGLIETPKHPRPALLWALLDAHADGDLPDDIAAWLRTTLDELVRGGIWDQIDRGFHRCTRNDRWIVPHFEKPIPLNARLAAVYARAADELENDTYRDIASRLASFCIAALREGVDVIASDTGYYTWTSKELLSTLDPVLVQVVTLHYDIKPVHERQALRRVVEMEQMDRFSHESVDVLRTRLVRGRAQMRAARQRRPAPEAISLPALAWRAETARWLLRAGAWSDAVEVPAVVTALERLVEGRLDAEKGYARDAGAESDPGFWLADQAALLAAFVETHRATAEPPWQDRARELADILLARWWGDGGWRDRPGAESPSRDAIDDVLPSPLGTLAVALRELGGRAGDGRYADRARETAAMRRSLALASDHWSALVPD
jgi:uncharacterized protein